MSDAVTPRSSVPSIPKTILITSNEDQSKQVDLVGGLISIAYFENLMSDTLRATITFTDTCLLYTSPSPRDATLSRMPSSA